MSRQAARPLAMGIGLLGDRLFGEPPAPLHPVARFGQSMGRIEEVLWADTKSAGTLYCALGVGLAWGVGRTVEKLLGPAAALASAIAVCSAGRELCQAAQVVDEHLSRGDLEAARGDLIALVGRDPRTLDEHEVARAVVESLAENLSDAVVASVLWGLLAGAPGVLAHRAANTLDAMVGHHDARYERFGWASARLDDLLGWPAARATAVVVMLAAPGRVAAIMGTLRRDAPAHPSPNAGVAEAAVAAALGLRVGGANRYGARIEERPPLGDGKAVGPADIARALGLIRRCVLVLEVALLGWVSLGLWPKRSTSDSQEGRTL